MKAMILAAGRGERLRPLTDEIPKSLVEVGGESLLERHLRHVRQAGFGLEVVYSQEGDNVLETGGGIFKALPTLGDEPFLVVNADIYTDMPVPDVTLADDHLGHLVMVPTPDYRDSGDFDLDDGLVRNSERPAYTFSGVAIYRPELFNGCEAGRFPLAPILRDAAGRGQLTGSLYEGLWADVGTPDRLAAVSSRNQGGA
jgi:MurNAc alpha-1-phosphate uridylyltransferase